MRSLPPRRIAPLLALLSILAAAHGAGAQDPAALLPAGAHAVVAARDLEGFWSRFTTTRLFASISAMPSARQHLEKDLAWLSLFRESAAAGFYGKREDRPDMVAVAEVGDAARARTILAAVETDMSEQEYRLADDRHGDTPLRIARDSAGKEILAWALVENHLVAGSSMARVGEAIDLLAGGGGATMAANPDWNDAARRMASSSVVAWIDLVAVGEAVEERTGGQPIDFARAIALGLRWAENGLRGDAHVALAEDLPSDLAAFMTAHPGPVRSIGLVPDSTLVLFSTSSFDAGAALTGIRRGIMRSRADSISADSADSMIAAGIARFEARTTIDLEEELLPAIGREFAFAAVGVDRGFMFPIPRMAILVEVRDEGKARTVLEKLERWSADELRQRRSISLSWQDETYQGVAVRYAPTPLGESIEPAYVVEDGFALIASSRTGLHALLDTRADRASSLAESPGFAAMSAFFPAEASGLVFLDLAAIAAQVRALSGMGMSIGDSTGEVTPLLDALENAPRFGMWAEPDPESGVWWHGLLEVR
jgi:hypothetical protein